MIKKSFSKFLSIVLTMAICATTIFGCILTTNAENTPSYIITGAECMEGDTAASATVELNVPQGFAAGTFKIDNVNSWYSSVAVTLISEKLASTDEISIDVNNGNVMLTITGADNNAKLYTNVTLKLDFVFSTAISNNIDVTISDLDFNGLYTGENYTSFLNNSTNAVFTAGCQHEYVVSGDAVYGSQELGYTLYNYATCSKCGDVANDYQVVPEVGDNDGEIVVYSGSASTAASVSLLDPTKENSESNPYIIEYPTQLHALAIGALKNDNDELVSEIGAYFKVKDGIKAFVMQSNTAITNDIISISSGDDVKEYFTNNTPSTRWWSTAGSSSGKFSGHFDGNGIEIYGICANETGASAMFSVIGGYSSFKNFTIKNSYISANSDAGVALIVGKTLDNDITDIVTIENCSLINNYVAQIGNHQVGASAIVGNLPRDVETAENRDSAIINNCLIYNNIFDNSVYENANSGSTAKSGIVSDGGHNPNFKIENVISLGTTPWTCGAGGWYLKQINDGTIKNVYSDASQADWDAFAASNSNNTEANALKHNINFALDVNTLKGETASTTANVLDWNTDENPNGVWFTGNAGQYPSLLKKNVLPAANATSYEWKLLGVNIIYENDGSFALNFHYDPSYESDAKLYVANAENESKSQILTESTTSSFAGDILPASARMFTLNNLSARDIEKLWIATVVTTSEDDSEIVYGKSEKISIGEYAEKVVLGDAFYNEEATESQKTADKNVAAALINYGIASNDALNINNIESASTATIVEKWDKVSDGAAGDWYDATFESGDGSQDNPYIISSAEELAWVCKNTTVENSAGVYYKVDESIKAFDMNTVSGVDLTDEDLTANEVYDSINGKILGKVWHPGYSGCFAGNFDGSGVTIYGLYAGPAYYNQNSLDTNSPYGCTNGGLFSKIDTSTASFKNFSIKNSYFTGDVSGAVFGDSSITGGSVSIENVVVANCYIKSTGGAAGGVLGGYLRYDSTTIIADKAIINNCLVYDNVVENKTGDAARLIGLMEAYCNDGNGTKVRDYDGFDISNTIAIGSNIENTGSWWQKDPAFYSNCYTTETPATENTTITKLSSVDAAKGIVAKTNMPALDWETVWMYGDEGEYPSIVLTEAEINPVSEYSGTPDTSSTLTGSGTSDDPYIIETADQFAAIALGKRVYDQGSYFKVDPNIKSFYINGGSTVASMTTVADVEAYFEAYGGYDWASSWDNATADSSFSGHFDGSGVTIYGLYDVGNNAGLFEMAEDESSFKNFSLKNSYIKVSSGAGVAAIVGKVSKQTDPDIMTFENIVVANNHIEQSNTGAGAGASIILGYIYNNTDGISINKCVIYGNNLINPNADATYGLVSVGGNGSASLYKIRNVIALGVKPYTNGQGYYLRVLDGNKCFVNVYTDKDCSAMNNYNESNKATYNFNDNIDISLLQGSNAVTTLGDEFDWDTTWFAGAYNDYPALTPVGILPSYIQSQYDAVEFKTADTLGNDVKYHANGTMSFGVYQTALSLKANPYMSFAFAFLDEYRENRDDITITFTYTVNGTQYTTTATPPAYDGSDIKNVDGWTNTAINGRYHTYKATNIPVEALANGVTVTANYGGIDYDFGTYSVAGLGIEFERANRINPCEYYATRIEAVKALLFYTQMIHARYGAQ